MTHELNPGDPFIFMKVGVHASESLADIIARKRLEIEKAGVTFWGYGGATCHPLTAVQPFVKGIVQNGGEVRLLMQEITSHHYAEGVAQSFSIDGINYQPIPAGIKITGSRYALVLDSLDDVNISVALSETRVGIGRLEGKVGADYVKGRVDKACLVYSPPSAVMTSSNAINLRLEGRLAKPFAVLLK